MGHVAYNFICSDDTNTIIVVFVAGHVAQLAERWTPRGESTRPGYNSPGSKRDGRLTFMSLLTGMVAVGGRP